MGRRASKKQCNALLETHGPRYSHDRPTELATWLPVRREAQVIRTEAFQILSLPLNYAVHTTNQRPTNHPKPNIFINWNPLLFCCLAWGRRLLLHATGSPKHVTDHFLTTENQSEGGGHSTMPREHKKPTRKGDAN